MTQYFRHLNLILIYVGNKIFDISISYIFRLHMLTLSFIDILFNNTVHGWHISNIIAKLITLNFIIIYIILSKILRHDDENFRIILKKFNIIDVTSYQIDDSYCYKYKLDLIMLMYATVVDNTIFISTKYIIEHLPKKINIIYENNEGFFIEESFDLQINRNLTTDTPLSFKRIKFEIQ